MLSVVVLVHVERKWSLGTQLGRDKNKKKRQNSNATSETEIKQQQ